MNILMTNNALDTWNGSELYVKEVAGELIKKGHDVVAYSNICGKLAGEMNKSGIRTVNNLNKISKDWPPDIIHGQHHLETMTAIAHFPNVPVVYFCHGWRPWQEKPPIHPRIIEYVTVDLKTLEFMVKCGVPRQNIKLIHNFVDLERFKQRKPLPIKPEKALIFSNHASENEHNYSSLVRQACQKAGIKIESIGLGGGRPVYNPEKILKNYDLIFGVGKSALEALATGLAVVICGEMGVGPMISTKNMKKLRDLNFGVAAMFSEPNADAIFNEISKYNAEDSKALTKKIRSVVDVKWAINKIEKLYFETLGKNKNIKIKKIDVLLAESEYLREISWFIKRKDHECNVALNQAGEQINHLSQHNREISKYIQQKDINLAELIKQNNEAKSFLVQKEAEIINMKASKFWKARELYWFVKRKIIKK